jgi:hypothetical protein
VTSPHGGNITVIAATADGDAAVSADALGSVRLWPALDGSVEPHVVELPAPTALAVRRMSRGFLLAAVDSAGGLTVHSVDARGLRLAGTSHAAEPAFEGVVASARGVVAWRADHTIVRLGDDGAIAAQLAAGRGERVRAVAAAGEHMVAVLEEQGGVLRVRTLQVGPDLAWGPVLPLAAPLLGSNVALSSDGTRLAATRPLGQDGVSNIDVFDLPTGKRIASHPIRGEHAIGFVTPTLLAVEFVHRVIWLDLEHPERSSTNYDGPMMPIHDNGPLVAAGGLAISGAQRELRISRRTEDRYLGYRFSEAYRAAVGPRGELVIPATERALVVDRDLRELRELDRTTLGTNPGDGLTPFVWLGDDLWFVQDVEPTTKQTRGRLVDVGKGSSTAVSESRGPRVVRFEPTTGLLTAVSGAAYEIFELDRAAGKLVRISAGDYPGLTGYLVVMPVAPDLAGGTRIVLAAYNAGKTEMRWCSGPTALDQCKQGSTEGYPVGFARNGHVTVYEPSAAHETRTFLHGKRVRATPDETGSRWPSPDGSTYVFVGGLEVSLRGPDGVPRWRRTLGGGYSALWASDGTIVITSMDGMVRVDARTGEPLAARCGWKFELSPTPHGISGDREPLCTQL